MSSTVHTVELENVWNHHDEGSNMDAGTKVLHKLFVTIVYVIARQSHKSYVSGLLLTPFNLTQPFVLLW